MGLFDKIFRPEQAKESQEALREAKGLFTTLTAYQPVFTTWRGAIYESLIVRSAIDARARHISKLKPQFTGTANLPLQSKMKQGPNQFQTWSQFLYRASTILDCTGNVIFVPVFDERMVITGYYTVLPQKCEVIDYNGEPWLRYKFAHNQVGAVEMRKCGIMTKHQYERDFFGDNNRPLEETMKLIHIQNQGIEEGVKSAATYRFMATLNNFAKAEDLKKERQRFTEENFSSEGGGLLLFPNTYTNVQQVSAKPFTADAEQMELIRANVFEYFGVNEDVLQNKAYGDAWSAFYEGCVESFAIQFSDVMTKMLFTLREQTEGNRVTATANRMQYMSNADKLNVSAAMLDRGLMTINEIRDIWNLAPVEGGDVRMIRGEYYNAGDKTE